MPNGYGVSKGGKADPELSKAIAGLAPPSGDGAAFATASGRAVRRLAQAAGVTVSAPAPTSGNGSTRDRILIGGAALAALALAAANGVRRRPRAT